MNISKYYGNLLQKAVGYIKSEKQVSVVAEPREKIFEPTIAPVNTTGQRLAEARRKLGMSVEDIANSLYLAVEVITAIENREYDSLYGKAYVTGYVRAYASLVNLNADELIDYDPDLGVVSVIETMVTPTPVNNSRIKDLKLQYWGVFAIKMLLLFITVGVGIVTWHNKDSISQWWNDTVSDETTQESQNSSSPSIKLEPSVGDVIGIVD